MNDNIVSFPDQHKAAMVRMLQELIEYISISPENERFAIAMVCQDDKGTGVRCMGFKDDEATGKYLSAFIRNQGLAS
jgi:hypothetical protein